MAKEPFNFNKKSATEEYLRGPKLPAFPSQGGTTFEQEQEIHRDMLRKTGRFPPEAFGEPTPTATPSMPRDVGPQGLPSRGPTDRRPVADGPTAPAVSEEQAQPTPFQTSTSPEGPKGAGRTPFFDVYTDEVAARVVQEDLAELGYTSANGRPLEIDGEFGMRSGQALMKFQRASGLPEEDVTGEWNRNTSILLETALEAKAIDQTMDRHLEANQATEASKLDDKGRPISSPRPPKRDTSTLGAEHFRETQDPRGEANEYTKGYQGGRSDVVKEKAIPQLKVHEGYKPYPYLDSKGLWTIGIGHLIGNGKQGKGKYANYSRGNPMPEGEVLDLFDEDYAEHSEIAETYPAYEKLGEKGKLALIDMTFNMGNLSKGWPNFLKNLEEGRLQAAVNTIRGSSYAKQVGDRSEVIAELLLDAHADLDGEGGGPRFIAGTDQWPQEEAPTEEEVEAGEGEGGGGGGLPEVKADQLGMIGGVRDDSRVWQSFNASGMAHSTDYKDYSQLFREYTTKKKNGYVEVGKTKDGKPVYAAPDNYKDKDGNYVMVSKDDAIRMAKEMGSIMPQREWVKNMYGQATRVRMATQPIYKTGGSGDSLEYTTKINAALKKKGYKQGLVVHGKEFFVSK